jgi:hypothetical protein
LLLPFNNPHSPHPSVCRLTRTCARCCSSQMPLPPRLWESGCGHVPSPSSTWATWSW